MAIRTRKVFGTFKKRAPGPKYCGNNQGLQYRILHILLACNANKVMLSTETIGRQCNAGNTLGQIQDTTSCITIALTLV